MPFTLATATEKRKRQRHGSGLGVPATADNLLALKRKCIIRNACIQEVEMLPKGLL